MNRDDDRPPAFEFKSERMAYDEYVMENCSLDLFVALDLDLEPI
jgi:hypothetical protein